MAVKSTIAPILDHTVSSNLDVDEVFALVSPAMDSPKTNLISKAHLLSLEASHHKKGTIFKKGFSRLKGLMINKNSIKCD